MPVKILMPTLSPTMTVGAIVNWVKKDGEYVSSGDVLAEVESDKASQDVESLDSGTLKIIVPAGTREVKVYSVIALLMQENETEKDLQLALSEINCDNQQIATSNDNKDVDSNGNYNMQVTSVLQNDNNSDNKVYKTSDVISSDYSKSRIFASPLAKNIAQKNNIDLNKVKGSGPAGRIVKSDVLAAIDNGVNNPRSKTEDNQQKLQQYNDVRDNILLPHSNMRRAIAQCLSAAKTEIPHFYLTIQCNLDKLLSIREEVNCKNDNVKISINDWLIKIAAITLLQVPEINASWEIDGIRRYNYVDISIAVAVPDGVFTPIIKDADKKSLTKISREVKSLVFKAQKNELRVDEFRGGCFTISNLGMYGIKQFNAIINSPQSCIMSVGAIVKSPIVIDDQITIANVMDISLSCDHRVIDGALGARFLQIFKSIVENPIKMLV